jgi:hypothetical protein
MKPGKFQYPSQMLEGAVVQPFRFLATGHQISRTERHRSNPVLQWCLKSKYYEVFAIIHPVSQKFSSLHFFIRMTILAQDCRKEI